MIEKIQSAFRAYEVDTMKLPTTAQGIGILVEKLTGSPAFVIANRCRFFLITYKI
jgi:hypothetical protein